MAKLTTRVGLRSNSERTQVPVRLSMVGAARGRQSRAYSSHRNLKIDRLTHSLTDFAKLVEIFDAHNVTFVSVTQQFNTTTSMGCLTLNVLLSFAHYEREITGERIRDKCAYPKSTFLVNLHVHVSVSDLSKKFDEVVTNIPYKNRAG